MNDDSLYAWLDEHADAFDRGTCPADAVLPALAAAGVFRVGVPELLGGRGGDTADAVRSIGQIAEHSLTAAFVTWGQRTFIEYLLQSPNRRLRESLLPGLLSGELAGATGLSNAMKYLAGIEGLQVQARAQDGGFLLDGKLPWVTNLRTSGFWVACAAADAHTHAVRVFAVPHPTSGLTRTPDLALIGLAASNTAALSLAEVEVAADLQLHHDGAAFLRAVRPAFLALQCGMPAGVARASIAHALRACGTQRGSLPDTLRKLASELEHAEHALLHGLSHGTFARTPSALFELRIHFVELALSAVQHELQACGGKAYLRDGAPGFARRWNEAAFLPIVTPSCAQLRAELDRQRALEQARESA